MLGATSGVTRSKRKVQLLHPPTHRIGQKQPKARDRHAHHRRGHWSPLPQAAPPTHPAPCPCPPPARSAALRARALRQISPPRRIGAPRATTLPRALARDSVAAASRAHSRQHLQVVEHEPRPRGGRGAARRGAAAGRSRGPFSCQTRAPRWVSRASQGMAARASMISGATGSPHIRRRPRTSSGCKARASQRCCRHSVAVPAPKTLGRFPIVERVVGTRSVSRPRIATCPGAAPL